MKSDCGIILLLDMILWSLTVTNMIVQSHSIWDYVQSIHL